MTDKLQELTDRLYREGLSKGREEGEKMKAEASEEAARILSDAKKKAEEIISEAGKQAADMKAKAAADVKAASEQCLRATKKDIENLLVGSISGTETLKDAGFLKEIIKTVAEKFDASQAQDISLVLPEKLREETEGWVAGELAGILSHGVKATFSKKIGGGFTIGPADGSYFISLTDETFNSLIAAYLRPATKKLLFGE